VCRGTNLEAALRYAVEVSSGYDAVVLLTDARPTVGSRRPERLERLASELGGKLVVAGVGDYDRDIAGRLASASGGIALKLPGREWEAASLVLVASGAYEWWILEVAVAHPPWLSVVAPGVREGLPGWSFVSVPPRPPAGGIPLLVAAREGWEPLLRGRFSLPILAGLAVREGGVLARRWRPIGTVSVDAARGGLEGVEEVAGVA